MLRPVATSLTLIFLALASVACTSRSATHVADTPYAVSHLELDKLGYRPGWSSQVVLTSGSQVVGAQVLGDLTIVVEHPANIVTAFDTANGAIKWKAQAGQAGEKIYGPYRYRNTILVNTDRQLWGFNANDGKTVMNGNLRSVVQTEPALADELAIFGGADGRVFAIDVTSAQIAWEYKMVTALKAKPLTVSNGVFVADAAGVYAMLDADSGDLLWRGRTFGEIVANPGTDRLRVYVPSTDQSLYALDRTSGRDRWAPFRASVPLTESPLVMDREIFLPLPGVGMVALQNGTGRELWRSDLKALPLAMVGRDLLVRDDQQMYLLSPADGKVITAADAPGLVMLLVAPNSRLVAINKDGRVTQMLKQP